MTAQARIPFHRTLQAQLIFWFLVIGVLPLILMSVIAFINANNALTNSINDTLVGISQNKADRLNAWFADTGRMAESLANLPGLHGEAGVNNIGVSVISNLRDDRENREFYDQAYNTALSAMNAFVNGYARIDAAFLMDMNGTVVVSTDNDLIAEGSDDEDIRTLDFDAGLQGTHISDIVLSVDGVSNIFVVNTPVINDETNTTVGVLALRINLNAINAITSDRTGLGESGESYLVNINDRLMRTESLFTDNAILSQEVDTFAVQQAISGENSGNGVYEDYRGVNVLGAWNRLNDSDWVLLTELNTSEAYAPTTQLGQTVMVLVVLVALAIIAISYWIARSISLPIINITQSATRVAGGDLEAQVSLKSRNELGVLASAFNQMTQNIRSLVIAERENTEILQNTVTDYSRFVERVADGDLTAELDLLFEPDEDNARDDLYSLGLNLNNMVDSLRLMASQVREAASSVSSAATQIQAATTQQTATATEQDAAVTQTVATVEEVRSTVLQTSERAQAVADASQQSVQVSRSGQQSVTDTVTGMDSIRERVESIAENILMLSERTQQIGEIIDTVNALADQSKLLALNASIEAARAGEEGKGFAVVAMEVRQLAEQSREATGRVRNILSEIQQATNTAVMVTEEGSKGAESGMTMAQRAGEAIRELAATIEEAAQSAVQIAASTHQQTNGMDQLASAMNQIKQATAQTAASARQTEQSVHDLTEMAKRLELAAARYSL